jgi:predicted transcriptional regulator
MSTTAKTTDLRPALREVYKFLVDNWALSASDIADGTDREVKEVNSLLNRLARARLVDSLHVNGEKSLTWQSYYDTENQKGVWRKAARDFDKAFPKGEAITTGPVRANGSGPRYTEDQLAAGRDARIAGESWKGVAATAGVKSPVYFSKVLRATFPKLEKEAAAAAKKASRSRSGDGTASDKRAKGGE